MNVYEENRFEALLSNASDLPRAASVRIVSGGTFGKTSVGAGRTSSKLRFDEGRFSVGREGAKDGAEGSVPSSARGTSDFLGLSVGVVRAGEPLVVSESTEKRDIGRPKESREKRSG